MRDDFLRNPGIAHPIFQAPMGGGPTTPALVAAVSNAGGLGFIAAGYLTPAELREQIREVQRLTARPFGVNAFVDLPAAPAIDLAPMLAVLRRWAVELGADPPALTVPAHSRRADALSPAEARPAPPAGAATLRSLVEVALEAAVPVFSVTFGVPDPASISALHDGGAMVLGTATTVHEGRLLREAGVDAIIAQGAEAGAHRATFAHPFEDALIGTFALLPQLVDAVGLPVVASGGIMDGRGIVAAMALGAAAVQMGTAFLVSDEAGTSQAYRARLLAAAEHETAVTTAFSGRPARGIRNRMMSDIEASGAAVAPYPLQNELTKGIRRAAAAAGDSEALSLWAGQGLRLARPMAAGELVRLLVREMEVALAALPTPRLR